MNCKVKGTVRSLKNTKKNDQLYLLVPEKKKNLTLHEANLLDSEPWFDIIKGCDYVLHIASPIMGIESKDPIFRQKLMDSAVKGTLHVLEACKKNKIQKIVLTSSISAVKE